MDNRHWSEEHFVGRLNKATVAFIPPSSIQVKPMNVNTFLRRASDVILVLSSDVIVEYNTIQSPALVSTCNLLDTTEMQCTHFLRRFKIKVEGTNRLQLPTCRIAVKNPCGLKKPVIQNTIGRPSKHQEWNWVLRSSSSVNQKPRLAESQET